MYFFSIEQPLRRMRVRHPVQRLADGLRGGGAGETFFDEGTLFGAGGFRLRRDKERSAATRQQLHSLFVLFPGDLGGEPYAVAVDGIEGIVLGQAEAEGVDAHFDGARPFVAAGVVADAVELEETGGEVRDGVAADEVHRL